MKTKEKKEKNKNSSLAAFLNLIKELWKDPKGKALLFFGFYLFFFIFLGIAYRLNSDKPKQNLNIPNHINENQKNYSLSKLLDGNYNFTYKETINDEIKEIEGKSYNKMKDVFDSLNEEYFIYSGITIKRENNMWKVATNPFYYRQLMEESVVNQTLERATFESKTVYQDNEALYRYQISTTTLYSLYQKEEIDIADEPNTIIIRVDKDGNIKKIFYDYSNYETYLKNKPSKVTVEVTYSDYGKIPSFEVPA